MKRCVDCAAHPAVKDGSRCPDCLKALLRATRPPSLRVTSPWVQRVTEGRGVAKVFG